MRFLLDANMPRSAVGAVQRLGHEAVDVREIGLGEAEDKQIAAYAQQHDLVFESLRSLQSTSLQINHLQHRKQHFRGFPDKFLTTFAFLLGRS